MLESTPRNPSRAKIKYLSVGAPTKGVPTDRYFFVP
jgi:hypothetical protein